MQRVPRVRRLLFRLTPLLALPLLVLLPSSAPPPITLSADQCIAPDDQPCTECCTSLLAGREATADGSTMTSHSCDSGTDRTWIKLEPNKTHPSNAVDTIWLEPKRTTGPDDPDRMWAGTIPQAPETFKFMDTAYPAMNEHQLAIGETTTGGKRELRSRDGLIDAPELYRLVLERARTAREAIHIADELTKEFGYNDWGECFTFADPEEVWFFEILGPGAGKIGAVWAAVRIPDDEIAVSANAHRILELNLSDSENYMASDNIHTLAEEMEWWDPDSGEPFQFAYAYADRIKLTSRRREWRALSLLADSHFRARHRLTGHVVVSWCEGR
jgi:dipeptidase